MTGDIKKGANLITETIKKSMVQVLDTALNTEPCNDLSCNGPSMWSLAEGSTPQVLANGSFSEKITDTTIDDLTTAVGWYINATIVGSVWAYNTVYIAKRTKDIPYKDLAGRSKSVAPCDLDVDKFVAYENARICTDDGVAYFFFRWAQSSSPTNAGEWDTIPGLKEVEDLGFTLEDVVMSSDWVQTKYNDGYQPDVSPDEMVKSFLEGDDRPPKDLWLNLPVVDTDPISMEIGDRQSMGISDGEVSNRPCRRLDGFWVTV